MTRLLLDFVLVFAVFSVAGLPAGTLRWWALLGIMLVYTIAARRPDPVRRPRSGDYRGGSWSWGRR